MNIPYTLELVIIITPTLQPFQSDIFFTVHIVGILILLFGMGHNQRAYYSTRRVSSQLSRHGQTGSRVFACKLQGANVANIPPSSSYCSSTQCHFGTLTPSAFKSILPKQTGLPTFTSCTFGSILSRTRESPSRTTGPGTSVG